MVLGFDEVEFVGLFSSEEQAKKFDCIDTVEIDDKYVHPENGNTVNIIKIEISTGFDDILEHVIPVESLKIGFQYMYDNLESYVDCSLKEYVNSLEDDYREDVTDSAGNPIHENIITNISIDAIEIEPDKYYKDSMA